MARPRVFVSSTFYDLRTVRDDLDRFIRGLGYEPVRHESGHVPYGKDDALEKYAYREIDFCDILVCVIGGRFGTRSADDHYSITQKELKSAIERGKQVFVFVEEPVLYEYRYYLVNKSLRGLKYTAVDNTKVYEFLEEIHALPKGNPIFPFRVSSDITAMLQEQFAGIFQRLLSEHSTRSQTALVEELQRSLSTVGQLVQFLTEEKGKGEKAVQEILFANHPVFEDLRQKLKNKYRIYFTNFDEMKAWLEAARSFEEEDMVFDDSYYEFSREVPGRSAKREVQTVRVKKKLFGDDGKLLPMQPAEWQSDLVVVERAALPGKASATMDDMPDDIPF